MAETAGTMSAIGGIVGRASELDKIRTALAESSGGRGRVMLICGEPGIGKTRLAQEIAAQAELIGARVVWGRAVETAAAPPLWPWVQIIRALAASGGRETVRAAALPGAGDIAQIVPELKELVEDVEPPPLLVGEAARLRLYDAVVGFVLRLAADRPLVVIAEDLHWADVQSLQLFELLAAELHDAPVLLLMTYRDLDVESGHPLARLLAAIARQPLIRLNLAGLDPGDVAAMIAAATGAQPDESVAGAIHQRTEGNPLFVAELVRLLQSEGRRISGIGTATLREVPAGVREVIRQRLQRLPNNAVVLLRTAAVIGPEFDVDVLLAASDLDEQEALDLLEACLAAGVVAEATTVAGGYRFSHALFREGLYRELSGLRRARLHWRAGEAILAVHRDDDESVMEVAHHLWEGRSAGRAEEALQYVERAADRALKRLAYEYAQEQMARASQLVDGLPAGEERAQHQLRLHLLSKSLLSMTKGFATAGLGDVSAAATELARSLADARNLVASLWGMWVFRCVGGDFGRAQELAGQLLELQDDDPSFGLAGHYAVGVTAWHLGRQPDARGHLEQAVAVCDTIADPELMAALREYVPAVSTRTFCAMVLCLLGEDALAQQRIEEAHAHATDPYAVVAALMFDSWLGVYRRDPSYTLRRAERAVAMSKEHAFSLWEALATILRGWARAVTGEPGAARAAVPEMLATLAGTEAMGAKMLRHFFLGLVAEAHWRAGDPEAALTTVNQALAASDESGECFFAAELYRLRANLLALDPARQAQAEDDLRRAAATAHAQHAAPFERRAAAALAQWREPSEGDRR